MFKKLFETPHHSLHLHPCLKFLQEFIRKDYAQGVVLLICSLLALFMANSFLEGIYNTVLFETNASVALGNFIHLDKPLILWINDALMSVFFFLIGLELKREIVSGMLSKPSQVALPIIAAVGGIVAPALIFAHFNHLDPEGFKGWAIPTATDIAFAVGIFSIVGKGIPPSLKIFLLALAIIDDLGAILIIGLFYSHGLSFDYLAMAGIFLLGFFILNRLHVTRGFLYLMLGIGLWYCILKSGIHATIAGVVSAAFIPLTVPQSKFSLLKDLEHRLHFWVAFAIMPIFALANAGINLDGASFNLFAEPITLGIILGLFLGKQIGITAATFLAVKLKIASLPEGCRYVHIWGVSIIAGIGFTMSLFVASLAFGSGHDMVAGAASSQLVEAKVGILTGSALSAIIGLIVLKLISIKDSKKKIASAK